MHKHNTLHRMVVSWWHSVSLLGTEGTKKTSPFLSPPLSLSTAEAEKAYGRDKLKIYRTSVTPMYYAVTKRKVKAHVKLICLLPTEKVCIM